MKLLSALLLCLFFVTSSDAESFQYSSGWSPGQTTRSAPSAGATPLFKPQSGRFSWSSILTSGPIGHLFARSGVNISEKLEEAQQKVAQLPWDERIPMIRDDNFQQLIINETFSTSEEEAARVWFLVVTVTSSQRTGVSAMVDKQFDEAYNISLNVPDLPYVRWGRIDYFNVTRLTTKWAVWRAPMLIVAKDRGKTLRFFHPQQLRVKAHLLHDFLVEEHWIRKQPWSGPWAPGGSRENLLDKFAIFQENLYYYMTQIPRWMYLVISGGLGSLLINLFHRKPTSVKRPSQPMQSAAVALEQQKENTTEQQEERKSAIRIDPTNTGSPSGTKKGGSQRQRSNKK